MFALSLIDFLSLLWGPRANVDFFLFFVKNIISRTHKELLPLDVFFSCHFDVLLGVTYANMLVASDH